LEKHALKEEQLKAKQEALEKKREAADEKKWQDYLTAM
jgi:hypothetical protein